MENMHAARLLPNELSQPLLPLNPPPQPSCPSETSKPPAPCAASHPLLLTKSHPVKSNPATASNDQHTLMRKIRAGLLPLWLPVASVQLLMSAPDSRTISRTLEPEGPAAHETKTQATWVSGVSYSHGTHEGRLQQCGCC